MSRFDLKSMRSTSDKDCLAEIIIWPWEDDRDSPTCVTLNGITVVNLSRPLLGREIIRIYPVKKLKGHLCLFAKPSGIDMLNCFWGDNGSVSANRPLTAWDRIVSDELS